MADPVVQSVQYPKEMSPEDIEAQKKWEQPAKERRIARRAFLDAQRKRAAAVMVVLPSSVDAAFQSGDPVMLDAAQEECLRVLDIIRDTRRGR